MIARSKTKTSPKNTKPASKAKMAPVRGKPVPKVQNKKAVIKKVVIKKASAKKSIAKKAVVKKPVVKNASMKKPSASKIKAAKTHQKPAKIKPLAVARQGKTADSKKRVIRKEATTKNKASNSRTSPIQKATSTKMLQKNTLHPKPSAKPIVKPIVKPLNDAAKKKVAAGTQPKVISKLAPPPKSLAKTSSPAPITKMLVVAKPIVPPRPVVTGPPTNPKIVEKIRGLQETREQRKDLAQLPTSRSVLIPHSRAAEQPRDLNKDRLILMVRDPFWLHACWDITRKSVERAKAALAGQWHTARPVLRLLKTDDTGTTSNTENVYRDIEIHGAVRHWYVEIESPGSTFRLLLGYKFGVNRFHELARSNPVTPPIPGSPDSTDDHWADLTKDADRVYALSGGHDDDNAAGDLQQMMQEKLKRPIGNPSLTQFGSGAEGSLRRMKNFHLDLDAEMVVYGTTHPLAVLTVGGEPVTIRSDGSFSARVPFPNNRQVLAATSKSRDGLDEQTIVLAVERNTKIMEPLSSTEPDE